MSLLVKKGQKKLTILACGSRGFINKKLIKDTLFYYADGREGNDVTIITGAARGADTLADESAKELGFRTVSRPADWKRHGRKAGLIRNIAMLDMNPDLVLAFYYNQKTPGTAHTYKNAKIRGIPVRSYTDG